MNLYLIRHTSVDVPRGICYGATDVPLARTFVDEAVEVKLKLDGLHFDAVYTSPLSRAVRLADFCGYTKAIKDDRLREFDFGEWEMMSYDELYENDERFKVWCEDYMTIPAPGGESFSQQMGRFDSFVSAVKAQGYNDVAAFCHGGVLVCGLIRTGQVEQSEAFTAVPPYGSVIKLEL